MIKLKPNKRLRRDIKISVFWVTLGVLISASIALWLLIEQNKDLKTRLGACEILKSADIRVEEVR